MQLFNVNVPVTDGMKFYIQLGKYKEKPFISGLSKHTIYVTSILKTQFGKLIAILWNSYHDAFLILIAILPLKLSTNV